MTRTTQSKIALIVEPCVVLPCALYLAFTAGVWVLVPFALLHRAFLRGLTTRD